MSPHPSLSPPTHHSTWLTAISFAVTGLPEGKETVIRKV